MNLFSWFCYALFRALFTFLLRIKWKIMGVSKPPTGRQAQVMKVLWRCRFFEVTPSTGADFVCDHLDWEPSAVVLKPRVTLYAVDEQWATFVECDSDVHALVDEHPFFYQAQFRCARRVIRLPLEELHRVAASLPPPSAGQLVYLYSTGRCGSTVLQKCLSKVEGTLSLSEPDSYTSIALSKTFNVEQKKQLLQSISRLDARLPSSSVNRVVIKLRSQCTPQAAVIHEVAPDAHLFFMYRDAQDVAFSFVRAFADFPILNIILRDAAPAWLKTKVLAMAGKLFEPMEGSEFQLDIKPFGGYEKMRPIALTTAIWLQQAEVFAHLRKQHVNITGLRYEDLLAQPATFFAAMLKDMVVGGAQGVPSRCVDEAVAGMAFDSQAGSAISRKNKADSAKLTAEDIRTVQQVLEQHPSIKKPGYILDGTLLH